MKFDRRYADRQAIVVTAALAGFPLIAAITATASVSSRPYAIAFRVLVFLLSLSLLSRIRRHIFRKWSDLPLMLLLAFWITYMLRLTSATLLADEALTKDASVYWMFAIGACLVPMIAVAVHSRLVPGLVMFRLSFGLAAFACALAVYNADTIVTGSTGDIYDSGRLSLPSLNPISLGHLGASIALMGCWYCGTDQRRSLLTLIALGSIGLGIAALVMSGSRGPAVAFALSFFVLLTKYRGLGLMVAVMLVLSSLLLLNSDPELIEKVIGEHTFQRYRSAWLLQDAASVTRIESFAGAWQQFMTHPLFGDGLEERSGGAYPHNVIVESFMATGIFGGLFLTVGLLSLSYFAIVLVRAGSDFGWAGIVFLQYFIGAQFSGAIYASTTLWSFAGLIVAIYVREFRVAHTRQVKSPSVREFGSLSPR